MEKIKLMLDICVWINRELESLHIKPIIRRVVIINKYWNN